MNSYVCAYSMEEETDQLSIGADSDIEEKGGSDCQVKWTQEEVSKRIFISS